MYLFSELQIIIGILLSPILDGERPQAGPSRIRFGCRAIKPIEETPENMLKNAKTLGAIICTSPKVKVFFSKPTHVQGELGESSWSFMHECLGWFDIFKLKIQYLFAGICSKSPKLYPMDLGSKYLKGIIESRNHRRPLKNKNDFKEQYHVQIVFLINVQHPSGSEKTS
ncbi:hypothetical protein HUJ05_004843 [Dendroctonus ponderosae]|nr:hypothetical protein HUJ05_004843 [Dendroctonus ponderosae]